MKNSNITHHFFNAAALYPNKIALQSKIETISYAQLELKVNTYCHQFLEKGIKHGHKILVLHPLNSNLYAALLALLKLNCTLVFVEEWTKLGDISTCQKKINCDFIICNTKVGIIRFFIANLRTLKSLSLSLKNKNSDEINIEGNASDNAIISFSSGTSGKSKAIIRTHQLLNAQFEALKDKIDTCENAKMITNFPVVILLNLGLGITSYISNCIKMSNLKKTIFTELHDEIAKNKITHLSVSPYIINKLANTISSHKLSKLSLHQIISGGSPFFPSFVQAIHETVHAKLFTILYGSSEAEPIAHCDAEEIIKNSHNKGIFAGKIDASCFCKIGLVKDGIFFENSIHTAGEILVTGEHVVKHYFNSNLMEKENKLVIDGNIWHRTGDFGYFDTEQQLYLTGNLTKKVQDDYLLEIEKKLQTITGIERATIINLTAFIYCLKNTDESRVQKEVSNLFPFVTHFVFKNLPLDKRHNGKIKYNKL